MVAPHRSPADSATESPYCFLIPCSGETKALLPRYGYYSMVAMTLNAFALEAAPGAEVLRTQLQTATISKIVTAMASLANGTSRLDPSETTWGRAASQFLGLTMPRLVWGNRSLHCVASSLPQHWRVRRRRDKAAGR